MENVFFPGHGLFVVGETKQRLSKYLMTWDSRTGNNSDCTKLVIGEDSNGEDSSFTILKSE